MLLGLKRSDNNLFGNEGSLYTSIKNWIHAVSHLYSVGYLYGQTIGIGNTLKENTAIWSEIQEQRGCSRILKY